MTVEQQLSKAGFGPPKSRRSLRTIALDPGTVDALRKHRDMQELERQFAGEGYVDRDLVFADELGAPINPERLSSAFSRHRKAAGIPTGTLHTLRHTAATLALTSGVPVHIVAARLGDWPEQILKTYGPPAAAIRRTRRRARGSRARGRIGANTMIENWPSSHNRDEQRDRAKVSRRESVRGASTTSANRRGCWPRPTSCARSGTDHDGGSHPSPAIAEELEAIAAALKAGDLEDSRAINKLGSRAVRAGIELGRFGDDLWRNRVGLDG